MMKSKEASSKAIEKQMLTFADLVVDIPEAVIEILVMV